YVELNMTLAISIKNIGSIIARMNASTILPVPQMKPTPNSRTDAISLLTIDKAKYTRKFIDGITT
ncbi:TPA: hypothetical protein ACM69D_002245, partial [Escherichia coli]